MRQYIAQKPLDKNGLLSIEGKDYRYLKQVLRLSVGDMISVRFSEAVSSNFGAEKSSLQNMTVCRIDEKEKKILLQVCADSTVFSENQSDYNCGTEFILFMFVPKSSKFDIIVRQAVECGVSRIIPVSGEFSQKGSEKMNFRGDRFERIIKEARQQSGSAIETKIENLMTLKQACDFWKEESVKNGDEIFGCVLYERNDSTTTLMGSLKDRDLSKISKYALVCGAEGGISPDEIEELAAAGFKPVHLKTNILRCETAALYGIAALQNFVMEKYDE